MNDSSQDRSAPQDWRSAPRAMQHTPLYSLLGRNVVELAQLTSAELNRLRRHALIKTPRLDCGDLDKFFVDLITDTEILRSLFRPTRRSVLLQGRPVLRHELPFYAAVKAADRASASQLLLPHERGAAWLAGFAWSIGTYAAARPCLEATADPEELRSLLLETAFANLKRRNAALARTLAAALGGNLDDCNVAQVVRISTAARTANLGSALN